MVKNDKVDPFNYFQVHDPGHKYAISQEESEHGAVINRPGSPKLEANEPRIEKGQNIAPKAELAGAGPAGLASSRDGTIGTVSTCEESKKTKPNSESQDAVLMSNEEYLKFINESRQEEIQSGTFKGKTNLNQGNAAIKTTSWQRKTNNKHSQLITEIVNELISESSSVQAAKETSYSLIDVRV